MYIILSKLCYFLLYLKIDNSLKNVKENCSLKTSRVNSELNEKYFTRLPERLRSGCSFFSDK